ncbi:hypothetical protein FKP32DRAFT_908581 [Trametes sanguinea]|nr:hypothetical protein FKP32DRAFT_908581 [Trametes sanguinea]
MQRLSVAVVRNTSSKPRMPPRTAGISRRLEYQSSKSLIGDIRHHPILREPLSSMSLHSLASFRLTYDKNRNVREMPSYNSKAPVQPIFEPCDGSFIHRVNERCYSRNSPRHARCRWRKIRREGRLRAQDQLLPSPIHPSPIAKPVTDLQCRFDPSRRPAVARMGAQGYRDALYVAATLNRLRTYASDKRSGEALDQEKVSRQNRMPELRGRVSTTRRSEAKRKTRWPSVNPSERFSLIWSRVGDIPLYGIQAGGQSPRGQCGDGDPALARGKAYLAPFADRSEERWQNGARVRSFAEWCEQQMAPSNACDSDPKRKRTLGGQEPEVQSASRISISGGSCDAIRHRCTRSCR